MIQSLRFTKMLLAFCVLCLSAVMGGQNRVFAQGAEVTDVLTAEKCGLAGNTYVKKEYTSGQVTYILNDVMKGSQTPNKGTFQLNSKKEKHSYIAVKSIGNGYTVKSVTIEVNNANGSLQILGAQDPYAKGNQQPVGTSLKNDIKETITYNFEGSYPYFEIYANEKTGAVYINSITVVWNTTGGGSVETVAAPAINPASQKFSKAFDATITGAEGTTLKYTLDGSDPATSQTATAVEAATATVKIPAQTTTLKAIALKGDLVSQEAEAVYTYRAPSKNDGTFAKPYTVEEFKFWKPTQEVWVVGEILGNAANGENNFNPNDTKNTNVCIGTAENNMPVKLAVDEFRALNLYAKKKAVLMVKGAKGIYFNRTGIEDPTYLYIADPTQALASINVKTTEGYATYYNDKLGVTIPEGIDAKCGVITDVNNGALTIDYRYAAGTKKIPAGNAVLVKAGKAMQIPLIVSKHTKEVVAENMLKGQTTTGKFTADPDYKYYKLAYNNFNTKEGLGFYFGAENGGAFTVPAGMAYLAVPRSMAVKCFLLDGSATGIEGIEAGQTAEAVKTVYTLDGRKVEAQKLPKGIYIVNGKKVIVK